jgi:hypothetical protein
MWRILPGRRRACAGVRSVQCVGAAICDVTLFLLAAGQSGNRAGARSFLSVVDHVKRYVLGLLPAARCRPP